MPRKSTFPPRVCTHRQRGLDRCWVGGRWVYLGPTGSQEARQAYARLVAELSTGQPVRTSQTIAKTITTVSDVLAAWWRGDAPRRSRREQDNYRLSLRPLERLYGTLPAGEFRARHLEAVQLSMATGSWLTEEDRAAVLVRGDPAGWCANVVNRRVVRLRTVWRWAERQELVPPGSFAQLATLPGLKRTDPRVRHTAPARPAVEGEVELVASACPPVVGAMLQLQWLTGMRSGEVRTMQVIDVDTTGVLTGASSGDVWLYRPRRHKTQHLGQARVVPLGPRCRAVLTPWLSAALEVGPDAHVFPPAGDHSRCYTPFAYAQAVRRAAKRVGLPGWHAYRCRHGAKMRLTRAEGIDAARAVLGQRSVDSTSHYGGLDVEHAVDVQGRLG